MSPIHKIAVLSSGGDAPGMNAAIRSVVRTAIYHDLEVYGVHRGYAGLISGQIESMSKHDVANIIHRGGTILRSSRSEEFRTAEGRARAADQLRSHGIEALVVIGGNGSFTGADLLAEEQHINVMGVPGTIDNDLYGTDLTIGFDTAVNTAIEAVDRIRDTADSHDRVFFIEVMGRHAGFIALQTGIASGATSILLPERSLPAEVIIKRMRSTAQRHKLFNLFIVAEGNPNGSATDIERLVQEHIPGLDTRVTIIGHLQRGGSPNAVDRLLASRLGYMAVHGLIEGRTRMMVGLLNNKTVYTPLQEAIHRSKPIQEDLLEMARILAT